jgi:hypothetical protein
MRVSVDFADYAARKSAARHTLLADLIVDFTRLFVLKATSLCESQYLHYFITNKISLQFRYLKVNLYLNVDAVLKHLL